MKIKFWKVGSGDAITISYAENNGHPRNIFIDGGYLSTYSKTIKRELLAIEEKMQVVDLWIITHTDRDHIGGIEAFIKDPYFIAKKNLVNIFWFNWSSYEIVLPDPAISLSQGITLRDYLLNENKLYHTNIMAGRPLLEIFGSSITILSPDKSRLEKSKQLWIKSEPDKFISGGANDYDQSIEELVNYAAKEDTEVWNGGSIAFLFEYNNSKILFLADSHPSAIVDSLLESGYSKDYQLKVDYIKLSHHGSIHNISDAFLELVDCTKYIILANGATHPNKSTLVKILTHPERNKKQTIEFWFNDDTPALKSIFTNPVDFEKYNFKCIYSSGACLEIDL
jgi:beta-lactamase superfamily II metal-dependent hydrolase